MSVIQKHVEEAIKLIKQGENLIIHTSCGDEDSRVDATKEVFNLQGLGDFEIRTHTARLFGTALGQIIREVAENTDLQRIIFAGGDTSSYAARSLDIEALRMVAPISPGSPLCRVTAPDSSVDGLEVNFKGGQVGSKEYFGHALEGKSAS